MLMLQGNLFFNHKGSKHQEMEDVHVHQKMGVRARGAVLQKKSPRFVFKQSGLTIFSYCNLCQ